MSNVNMIPQYDTKLFTEVFDDAGTFVYYYKNIGIPTTISDANARTLYYLLYARYGNSPIANYDEEQFKYKIFSVVFQYGPTWEKRLSVQQTLRDMQLSDLVDNGQLSELFQGSGSNSSTSSGTNGNTRTLNTLERNQGTQTVGHTGTSTVDQSSSQTVGHTGTSTVQKTGTQGITHTGTSTVASTGTSALAHTGTVGVVHDNDVQNSGNDTTIDNHAFNPGTAPAQNAYDPLTYINEQKAQKKTLGTKSEQDESSTTTYQNTDTTTNNLQNQTTNNLTDTTTNNLSDTTTQNLTDTTAATGQNVTTNALTDQTTNDLYKSNTGTITDSGTTSNQVSEQDSRSNSTTTTMTAGKLKAYEKLLELLDSDVTGEFINKFKICFKQFVCPERTWIYVSEDND